MTLPIGGEENGFNGLYMIFYYFPIMLFLFIRKLCECMCARLDIVVETRDREIGTIPILNNMTD
jgi:hypothetical protein